MTYLTNTPIFSIPICTAEEIYDYYDDPDSVDCVPPSSAAPKLKYLYNTAMNCPSESKCVKGSECGAKGISKNHYFLYRF